MVMTFDNLCEEVALLQERLKQLEQRKLIGGTNIRVTEVDNTLLLIEQVDLNTESEILAERLSGTEERLDDFLSRPELTAGNGLILRDNGIQQVLELDPGGFESGQTDILAQQTGDDFPFRVRLDDTQPEGAEMKNFVLCAGGGDMPEALVYAGTSAPLRIDSYSFQTDQNCCIFLRINLQSESSVTNPGVIAAAVERADAFPEPDAFQYIVPIARILFVGARIVIQQMQFGNIYIAGRIV